MALTLLEPIIVNTAANFTFANASVTSNITAGNVKTDNLLYANGAPYIFTTSAAGSNTQVQFNDANAFAGSANFTFNKTSNTLSVTNIVANGAGLTALNGSNITGAVAYATTANSVAGANVSGQVANALVAGTVYTNAQPNITSVGLLTSLSVGPNSSITLTGTSGFVRGNAIQGTDGVNAIYPGYNGVSGAVGITSNLTVGIGSAGNITANGNVTANYFIGNGSNLTSIAGANVTGQVANALVAGTVYTNAQPNITSVGTLTNLGVSGNATIDGNLTVSGNLVYVNVDTLRIEDPIIELGGGVNGAALTSNDGKDRGSLLHYYTTTPVDAFMGWDNSNAEFGFGSNVSVTAEVVTFNSYGNIRANNFLGNGSQLASLNASSITSGTLAQVRLANSSLTVNGTAISLGGSGTITANTTQTLTLGSYLTGTSFNGGTAVTANVDATSANTANKVVVRDASGNFSAGTITATLSGAATTAGTVTTNAQPNITSVGTLTGLTSNGVVNFTNSSNVSLGSIGNVKITGGTNGQYLITDGAGNLSFTTLNVSTSSISNGNSNVNIPAANGNINLSAAGNANILVVTGTGINVAGTLNATGNANVGNIGATGVIATTLGGSLTTSAQPNITSVGTLTGLISTGNVIFSDASNINLGAETKIKITGGTSGQYLSTDGTGNLSWSTVAAGGGSSISNGTSNVNIPVANGNVTVSVNSVSNVVVFDENGFTVSGGTGNITGANYMIANYFSGNGSLLSSLTGANVTGQVANALVAGTVYTNAQPNITSIGALTALNVTGVSTFYTAQDRFSVLTGATGIVAHNMSNGAVFYHTSPAANFTPNFTNVPTTNNFITVAVIFIQQGTTPYMPTATANVQIDGSNITVKWINGVAPTGAASTVNMISYSLIRSSGAWSVLGQGAAFA